MLYCNGVAKETLNPFNIKYDKNNKWIGQIGQYRGFVKFSSQGLGIRAGVKLLYRYVFVFHLLDIVKILEKFCPPSVDGNSFTFDNYVCFVTKKVGVYDIRSCKGFMLLCQSIAFHECSIQIPDTQLYFVFDMLHLEFNDKKF